MIVVSLFNGMNTGRQSLENCGHKVTKYYSSELKPYAIELTQHHFPDTIQVGDVTKWKDWDIEWEKVDLILSGSPCQDLSIAGKRKGIQGSKSSLFWVFIDILEHVRRLNPDVIFFQENVGSAPKKDIGIMSRAMGVYPVRFNSSLVTAQLRDRYYWTNAKTKPVGIFGDLVTDIPEPKDRNIKLIDVITDGWTDKEKPNCILESESRMTTSQESLKKRYVKDFNTIVYLVEDEVRVKTNTVKGYDVLTEEDCLNLSFPSSITRRGRVTKGKAPCLLQGNEPLYVLKDKQVRMLNKIELCRLQGFPDKEILCIFVLCKKEIIEFVDAVEKNQKLQKIVANVMDCNSEKELLEFVSSVKKNMKQKNQQIEYIAVQNADTLIPNQCEMLKKTTHYQKEKNLIVENVVKNILYQNQELEEDFAISNAFINITQEKTTIFGMGEYPQLDKKYTVQSNGKNPLKVCGKEIMQLVENAELISTQNQVQNLTCITSYRLSQSSIEQMLIIYYWYAKNAIIGFTHQKIKIEILYLNVRIIEGYCDILTRNKAASLLGDGWTLPIIEHFFKFINITNKNIKHE